MSRRVRPNPLVPALLFGLAAMSTHAATPRLTVYSGGYDAVARGEATAGYALVRQPVRVAPDAAGDWAFDALPRGVDPATLSLEGNGIRVRAQRFDFAGLDQSQLLRLAIGQRISVEQLAPSGTRTYAGVLLAAGDGLTLREDDGRVRVLAGYSGFTLDRAPAGLVARPTLRIRVDGGSERDATLGYATAGLAWKAEYRLVLAPGPSCRMAVAAHAMVANRSGADIDGASLTLVAGEPNRVGGSIEGMRASGRMMTMAAPAANAMEADGMPQREASAEYHAYVLPGEVDLPDGSLQRLPLMPNAPAVTCERRYPVESPVGAWIPNRPLVHRDLGGDGDLEVRNELRFRNDRAAGLGEPLPAGRVRVFDGESLLGEAMLDHTAAGRDVALDLGRSFDLSARRRSMDFALDRAGRTLTETVEWTLRNAKDVPATLRVGDGLPRWTEWVLLEGGDAFAKKDAQRIEADVVVPAGGERTVRYTVRYRWAADVTID